MESFLAGVWPRPVRDDTAGRTEAKCVCVCVCACVVSTVLHYLAVLLERFSGRTSTEVVISLARLERC